MIIDTDVIIWYLRGNQNALECINQNNGFYISAITYMELIQGMHNKQELMLLRKAMQHWNTQLIYLSEAITNRAIFYVEQHFLSHSVQMADALIGATAVNSGFPLITANVKHYQPIKEIELIQFKP